jgi:probable rRNA maturation factor
MKAPMWDLVFRNTTSNKRYAKAFFDRVLSAASRTLSLPSVTHEISINLVGDQRIRSLNKRYRQKDAVTDVLSFPLAEEAVPGYTVKALGDLFLCVPYAERAARHEGIALDTKMAWMTVHGLLHLLGYDHEQSDAAARRMADLEQKILKSISHS